MTLALGYRAAGTTIYVPFHTFDSNGASVTLTGLATTDIEIYKDGSVTTRSSDSGYILLDTDGIDFNGKTGVHGISIDLSDNSDSGFYEAGSNYFVVISTVTVDTRIVSFVAATFDIGAIPSNILAGTGAAVNTVADSYTLTTGTQSANTVSSTIALDGTSHQHTDTAGSIDFYYEFLIGGGSPSSVKMNCFLNSNNDDLEIHAYDWVGAAFIQIGVINGTNSTTIVPASFDLFTNMVGTGSDLGKVRIRFTDGAFTLTSATIAIDQIFVSHTQGTSSYALGRIWVDTGGSNTNTIPNVDGVDGNPVSTWAAALTLSTKTNRTDFHILNGSTIQLSGTSNNYSLWGDNWTLQLNGQSTAGAHFVGASVSGIQTGAGTHFDHCEVGAVTVADDAHFEFCGIEGVQTLPAGSVAYTDCYHHSSSPVIFDLGALIGNTVLHLHGWHGGIDFRNAGANSSTDTIHFDGTGGKVVINSNCVSGGTFNLRGPYELSNSGTSTVNDDARFDKSETFAEPTGVPASTATLSAKIGYIYMALRNKVTVTSTSKAFHDDAGNSEWSKTLSDDSVTYTEDEAS